MNHDYQYTSLTRRHIQPSNASQASTNIDSEDGNMTISCRESLEVKCSEVADSHDIIAETTMSGSILPEENDVPYVGELHINLEMTWDEDADGPNSPYSCMSGPTDSDLTRYVRKWLNVFFTVHCFDEYWYLLEMLEFQKECWTQARPALYQIWWLSIPAQPTFSEHCTEPGSQYRIHCDGLSQIQHEVTTLVRILQKKNI